MARFFKLTKSKSEQIPSVRRKTLKLAAALVASTVALPALSLTSHGYQETAQGYILGDDLRCGTDKQYPYIYRLDGQDQVMEQVIATWHQLERGGYVIKISRCCYNDFVLSSHELPTDYKLDPNDDTLVIRQSPIRAREEKNREDARQNAIEALTREVELQVQILDLVAGRQCCGSCCLLL